MFRSCWETCTGYRKFLLKYAWAQCIPVHLTPSGHLLTYAPWRLKQGGPAWLAGPLAQAWPSPASFGDDPTVPSNLEPSKFATCLGWAAVPKWLRNSQVPGSLLHHQLQLRHHHRLWVWICQSTADDCQPVFFSVLSIHHHQPQPIHPTRHSPVSSTHPSIPSRPILPTHHRCPISSFILYPATACRPGAALRRAAPHPRLQPRGDTRIAAHTHTVARISRVAWPWSCRASELS